MKLSCVISIFNRSLLFSRGLESIFNQTMPKSDFEVIIVDDNSTEDISKVYKPYLGKMNIRHIKYDHTQHQFFKEMNPDGVETNWYHTQAISANIGISKAQGEILLITQPEVIHNSTSFEHGYERARQHRAVFGEYVLASQEFNQYLESKPEVDFDTLFSKAKELGLEYEMSHMPEQGFYEMYWYIMYLPLDYAKMVNGVDLKYQKGVYAEDDQFKMRVRMAGCQDVWGGRPMLDGSFQQYIGGIHQSHSHESHHRQDRRSAHWDAGAIRNRELFRQFCLQPYTVANEEFDFDIWGNDLITEDTYNAIR